MGSYNVTKIEEQATVLHIEYSFSVNGEVYANQINFGLDYLTVRNGAPIWQSYLDDYVAKQIAWYQAQATPGAKANHDQYLGERKI